ncbi:MAG: hypothetical protein ACOYN5_01580 [Bacteroidales bacterium]
MTEEKEIEFSENEILMTRSVLQIALTTSNAPVATSILQKLSEALPESPESMTMETLTMRNRRKLLRNISGMNKAVPFFEAEPIVVAPVSSASIEEVVIDPQPIAAIAHNDINQSESIPATIRVVNLPKLNFFQHLLQKFRPAARL